MPQVPRGMGRGQGFREGATRLFLKSYAMGGVLIFHNPSSVRHRAQVHRKISKGSPRARELNESVVWVRNRRFSALSQHISETLQD